MGGKKEGKKQGGGRKKRERNRKEKIGSLSGNRKCAKRQLRNQIFFKKW